MADWQTHAVENQVDEAVDYDLFSTDPALVAAVERAGAEAFRDRLVGQGTWLGRAETYALAAAANANGPTLETFDPRGRRVDRVVFHPAWHEVLAKAREHGLVSLPFASNARGRWSAWAATFYLQGQVEAGVLCPATMTMASIPVLRHEPRLWQALAGRLLDNGYDGGDRPLEGKGSIWVGMGMTEKQGGSDVRANSTTAVAEGHGGRGAAYCLRGHKWFFSVPMSDAHLVVARVADQGPSCFFVPRWLPDGRLNGVRIQRLKDKVGNRSNASSEVEFQDAHGILVGEEGRGIPTIIEMATYTRLNCVLGSAAILRQCLVQAIWYARGRRAFGRLLVEQPLMRSVLADLALESEAALLLAMRLAAAFECDEPGATPAPSDDDVALARAWKRIMTPAAKFWVCKRSIELAGEAMEILGGNGYIDSGIMARLYREAPVNSIWEGSGNVMCLDVIRAIEREPATWQALQADLERGASGSGATVSTGAGTGASAADDRRLADCWAELSEALAAPADVRQALGRRITERLVLAAQAVLMRRHAPGPVAEAFVASRLGARRGRIVGALDPRAIDVEALLERAFPR